MRPEALDRLADSLRERLLAEPETGDGAAAERIAAWVDREAGLLDAETRAELVRRVQERAFGLGPLQPLLDDREVDEVMVSGTAGVWVERGGRPASASSPKTSCATRSNGSSHRSAAGSTTPPRWSTRGCPTARA